MVLNLNLLGIMRIVPEPAENEARRRRAPRTPWLRSGGAWYPGAAG